MSLIGFKDLHGISIVILVVISLLLWLSYVSSFGVSKGIPAVEGDLSFSILFIDDFSIFVSNLSGAQI
jgi:hypothetical protein